MSEQTRHPEDLTPHPKNEEIYVDDDLPPDFIDSIRDHGVREPLVVTPDDRIISGHRRWRAARQVGLESVPVRVERYESDLAEWEAIVDYNRQRRKTPAQIVNEAEVLMAVERERAKARQGTRTDLEEETSGSSEPEVRRSRDAVADQLGVGGSTLEKGRRVKEQAEAGDETAQEQWDQMKEGEQSFHGAYEAVRDAGDEDDTDTEADDLVETHTCAVCGDPWQDWSTLESLDMASVPVERLCIIDWPDTFVLHLPEKYHE